MTLQLMRHYRVLNTMIVVLLPRSRFEQMADQRKSEFAGGPGLIQPEQEGNMTDIQEVWTLYATNSAKSDEPSPRRVGRPEAYQESDS